MSTIRRTSSAGYPAPSPMASCRRRPATLRCVPIDPRCKGRTALTFATAQRCPIHCEGSFGDWTTCDPDPCSAGTRSRIYTVTTEKDFGGDDCSDDGTTLDGPLTEGRVEEVDCVYLSECPIDCVGDWSSWDTCTRMCMGEQSRSYTVSTPSEGAGAGCTATATAYDGTPTPNSPVENFALETRACNTGSCDAPSIHKITILIPITSFPREGTQSRATWENDFALGVGAAIRDRAASGRRRLQASLVRPLSFFLVIPAQNSRGL